MSDAQTRDTIIGIYDCHCDAEAAICKLGDEGLPLDKMTIISRKYETIEDIQGYYRPGATTLEGACQGALIAALLALITSTGVLLQPGGGLFFVSIVCVSAMVGAALGALVRGIAAAQTPRHQALKYRQHTEPGRYLVIFHDDIATYRVRPEDTWPPLIDHDGLNTAASH